MDDLFKSAVAQADAKAKAASDVPWKLDEPHNQTYLIRPPGTLSWKTMQPPEKNRHTSQSQLPQRLALYSWNIDFMLPHARERMSAAMQHLQSLIGDKQDQPTVSVMFLQECVQSDLQLFHEHAWWRSRFAVTDSTTENWGNGHYGTVALVDRQVQVERVFRVHYSQTRMQRDALFVDIKFLGDRVYRLCNTHLESLALEPAYRPPQMELCAKYMHEKGIYGAAVAGDFNAIQDFDVKLHSDNHLKDAFLETGGREDDAEGGHTWGQQAAPSLRERFGTSRMDKVFFCGGWRCSQFERFGADVVVEGDKATEGLLNLGFEKAWVTDHLGVKAVFELREESSL